MRDKVVVITGASGGIGAALAADAYTRPEMRRRVVDYFAAEDM